VPLCGPAVRRDDADISGNDPLSRGTGPLSRGSYPELPDDGPSSAVLLNASLPASSRDMPYASR
jgi:hypothetical protein